MPKSTQLEARLERLDALRREAPSKAGLDELSRCLAHKNNHTVARAARAVQEWKAADLIPNLVEAFAYFLQDAIERDPGCTAKIAIAEALREFGEPNDTLFLAGLKHVQREPAWGPPVDTAAPLRGVCAQALAATNYAPIHLELTTLIMDREPEARRAAISTLAWLGDARAELILRMKALAADAEPDIAGLVFYALMQIAPESSLGFVARYLNDDDDLVAEGAALALGESRMPEAFERLRAAWDGNSHGHRRKALLLPLALHRSEEAFEFVISAVRGERPSVAVAAVEALGLYTADPERARAVAAVAGSHSEAVVRDAYRRVFGD